MNRKLTSKSKKELKAKMAAALADKIKSLPTVYQGILVDDLVTAFENRLSVFERASSTPCSIEVADIVEIETA